MTRLEPLGFAFLRDAIRCMAITRNYSGLPLSRQASLQSCLALVIATAAVLGILVNAIFLIFKPAQAQTEVMDEAMAAADD